MERKKKFNTRKLTAMAMLAALSIVMVALVHFPIFPAAAFLEYDPADIPILICTFAYGPLAGICVTVIAAVIQGLTVSAASGVYGILMHVIATGVFVLVAGNIYKAHKTLRRAVIALIVGALSMAAVMIPANLLITPYFMGAPVEMVKELLLPAILPFNLVKAGINAIIVFLIYKPISRVIEKAHAR